jgi:hypothetical protein
MFTFPKFNNQTLKRITKIHVLLLAVIFSISAIKAQTADKDVSITSSGSGATLEDAKQVALRSATEQAFGAFISSKTEMFNDQVVADQMASVSSGNIISFEVLNETKLPDDRWSVTLNVLVSINKLTSFVEAKGVRAEFKGGLFSMNIKQQALNEDAEFKVVSDMFGILHDILQISFDYEIVPGTPQSKNSNNQIFDIPVSVIVTTNKNIDFSMQYLWNTLKAISLKPAEIETYKSINKPIYPVQCYGTTLYLRTRKSLYLICSLIQNSLFYTKLYTVDSGVDIKDAKTLVEKIDFDNYREFFLGEIDYNQKDYLHNAHGVNKIRVPEECTIYNVKSNEKIYTHSWKENRNISEIERITKYTAKPKGKVSTYTDGGYLLSFKKRKIIVSAINYIGFIDCIEGKLIDKLNLLREFEGWRIPSIQELGDIFNNQNIPNGLDRFMNEVFISDYYETYYGSNEVFYVKSNESRRCPNSCGGLCRLVKNIK